MFRALSSAATGMHAQEKRVGSIANNIANVNTAGYRKSRVEFQDMLYDKLSPAGAVTGEGTQKPTGFEIGQGVKAVGTLRDFSLGEFRPTGRVLDLAIEGDGFFQVQRPDGEILYTRDGSFKLDSQKRVVNSDGFPIEPAVTLPDGFDQFMVSKDGRVSIVNKGDTEPTEVGQIQLVSFSNASGLEAMGGNLFQKTPASGEPTIGPPGSQGVGFLLSGFTETSNVQMVEEMVEMISAQRAYESNSRVVKAADEMLRTAAQIK